MDADRPVPPPADLAATVRRRAGRAAQARRDGPPTLMRQLATVGVLGWIVVTPLLGGLAAGRWLDRRWHTGITFSAAGLLAGLAVGCWSAWRWMHAQR